MNKIRIYVMGALLLPLCTAYACSETEYGTGNAAGWENQLDA